MFVSKRLKCFLLILLILLLLVISAYAISKTNYKRAKQLLKSEVDINQLKETREKIGYIELDFLIDGNFTYYSGYQNTYFYYLSESNADTYKNLKLKISSKEKLKYIVLDEMYDKEKGFYIDFLKPISIMFYNDDVYYLTQIKITCLPIMNIETNEQIDVMWEEKPAIMQLYSQSNEDDTTISYIESDIMMRIRGAISSQYPKKQYKITLMHGDKQKDVSLLGMEANDEWTLDAMYSDFTKVKSKLSFDIWNEMNSYTINTFDNDVNSEYVIVFINNRFHGLYLLKEHFDWEKTGIDKKTSEGSGVLIKGVRYWNFDWNTYDKDKETYWVHAFQMKYPKKQENYSDYWDAIIPKIYTHFYDKENITEEYLYKNFDIANYNDYKIFIHFICGADNYAEKNVYLYMQNMSEESKVIFMPWDLDVTYGVDWDGIPPTYFYQIPEYVEKVWDLWVKSEDINNQLRDRYFELRKNILDKENIYKKIDSYYNKIKYTTEQDGKQWLEYDLDLEIKNIKEWIEKRLEFLDEYIRS